MNFPGVHLQAVVAAGDGPPHPIRILEDDRRGYLIAGLRSAPDASLEEFWFSTLHETVQAAVRLGVPTDAWTEIAAVDQVDPAR